MHHSDLDMLYIQKSILEAFYEVYMFWKKKKDSAASKRPMENLLVDVQFAESDASVQWSGSGDFFLACKNFRGRFNFFIRCLWRSDDISSCTPFPFLRPGSIYSGLASWDSWSWVIPDELHVSSISDRFPHCLDSVVSLLWLHWVKSVHVLV